MKPIDITRITELLDNYGVDVTTLREEYSVPDCTYYYMINKSSICAETLLDLINNSGLIIEYNPDNYIFIGFR